MSFFGPPPPGSSSGLSRGPVVRRVTVTRPVKRPLGSVPRPLPVSAVHSGSLRPNGGGAGGSKTGKLPSALPRHLKANGNVSGGTKGTKGRGLDSPSLGGSRSPAGAGVGVKRKHSSTPMESRIESESESESDSEAEYSGSGSDGAGVGATGKRKRANGQHRLKNAHGSTSTPGAEVRPRVDRGKMFALGETGREWKGFIGSEEIVRGRRRREAGDEEGEQMPVIGGGGGGAGGPKTELDKYRAYFPQEGFQRDGDVLPSVELFYPAKGCRERFILLTPISHREYKPMSELRNALRLILDHYIPPSHAHIFGTLSSDFELDAPSSLPSRLQSPAPARLATPSPGSSPAPVSPGADYLSARVETIGDALRKALAPNRRDGPGFLKAMERFNAAMQQIQDDGSLEAWLRDRPPLGQEDWSRLVDGVHDQAYSRVVGPWANELEHHPRHPDEVAKAISAKEDSYGELRHTFMSRLIKQTGLAPGQVFVDLGSGVGNCVVQAALQAGSESYGFELLPVPARCARLQLDEVKRRWAMWGLNGNLKIDVHEGDFRTHPDVGKRLRDADVVLVNNEVFPPSLNVDLTNMFLDLKDGAKIVSLKPFVPDGFRMTENNCDSFAAICKLSEHTYYRDWVSWKGDSGKYYVQVVDRTERRKFEEDMKSGRARRR